MQQVKIFLYGKGQMFYGFKAYSFWGAILEYVPNKVMIRTQLAEKELCVVAPRFLNS